MITNFLVFILFLYTSNYFNFNVVKGYDLVATKAVKDLFFIASLPYYPMLLILLIRSIGIDLKSFGFQEDKEFAEINEECIDFIRLFFLKCGLFSRLLIAVMRPIFSEMVDTYDNISFVIVKGSVYALIKIVSLTYVLTCVFSSSIIQQSTYISTSSMIL